MSEQSRQKSLPPVHPNCRCTLPGGDTLFRLGMLPDPPPSSWHWERSGYAAKHFAGQIFYRVRLQEGKA